MQENSDKFFTQTNAFRVYCNGVDVSLSPYDFTFNFNDNSPNGDVHLGEIKMSPEHAKIFLKILQDHIDKFETMFGVIPEFNEDKIKTLQSEGKIRVEEKNHE